MDSFHGLLCYSQYKIVFMTSNDIIQWIKTNVGPAICQAVADSGTTVFNETVMGGIHRQETGIKLMQLLGAGHTVPEIFSQLKGDYSQRPGEAAPGYHGFGGWQIDIGSFPDFIASGDWQDPYKCCLKAISVLTGDMEYLKSHFPFAQIKTDADLLQATIASYNCGAGKERSILNQGLDIDAATFGHNYSALVLGYMQVYASL